MFQEDEIDVRLESLSDLVQRNKTIRAALLTQLVEIEAEIKAAQREHNSLANRKSAINVLPYDLLAEIFTILHDQKSRHSEIWLSHVTQEWRHIATSLPQLWNRITLNTDGSTGRSEIISAYLSRSKSSRLDLVVKISGPNEQTADALRGLPPHIHRSKKLTIVSSRGTYLEGEVMNSLLGTILQTQTAPWLEELLIHGGKDWQIVRPQSIFHHAPSLKTLKLSRVALQCCAAPLGSLTFLSLGFVDPISRSSSDQFFNILSSATSLTRLDIGGDLIGTWVESASVMLPSLQCLYVNSVDTGRLLRAISAPRLEVLGLGYNCPSSLTAPDSSPMLLSQSDKLHTLVVQEERRFHDIQDLSCALPVVERLVTNNSRLVRNLLQLPAGEPVWPRLRAMSLNVTVLDVYTSDITKLFHRRTADGCPIETIQLPPATLNGFPQLDSVTVEPYITELEDYFWLKT